MANVGLVLAGGMAKGAYQIGVLKAVQDVFPKDTVRYISASSVGTLNAYAYATGKLEIMEEMWLNLQIDGIRSLMKKLLRKSYVFDTVDKLATDKDRLSDHLYTTCFNITKSKLSYINLRDVEPHRVRDYLKASVALPTFCEAVEIGGMKYLDGALIDNIPIKPLMKHPLDYIIVIHFDGGSYTFENEYFDNKLIKINFMDDRLIKDSLAFDKASIHHMIQQGYEKGSAILNMILANGPDDLNSVYRRIEILNSIMQDKHLRITGDIVLNNINKAMRKVISRNII